MCGQFDQKTKKLMIEESTIVIASGQHDLHYIDMTGRLQVDLYNYLRRDFNLTSYKLDYCAGYFIGDGVKKIEHLPSGNTKITSSNLMGLENGNYIHFEESSHSTDMYKEGEKFKVLNVNPEERSFEIEGREMPDMTKSVRWGLAKDDVTPQDIFRMTNEGPKERAILLAIFPEILRSIAAPVQQFLFGSVIMDVEIIRQLLYGLALILIMLYRPNGIWQKPEQLKRVRA
jgi:hypothetical protein